jgi:transmembrane protein 132
MNLAVLTGRQVSRAFKVFMVSEAGKIADVTLHSSCSSKDDSVIKVRIA